MNSQQELLEAMQILIDGAIKHTTQIFFGIVTYVNSTTHKCTIVMNDKTYSLPYYGMMPVLNRKYPIISPQGNFSAAFVFAAQEGDDLTLKRPIAYNFSGLANNNSYTEVLDGNIAINYTVTKDNQGRITSITDSGGHTTSITW